MGQGTDQRGNQTIHGNKCKQKHSGSKYVGCSKSSSKREVYSNIGLPQETRTISNKKSNPITEGIRKEQSPKLVEGRT